MLYFQRIIVYFNQSIMYKTVRLEGKMIVHVVGNRPQFIKLAPLFKELEDRGYAQMIIHSGQHYDTNLSVIFFEELNIPNPEINLQVGSGSHAEITAKAMIGLEKSLISIKPEMVILYGDTDTTLAGALAASKLNIPIAHVEGGLRTHHKENPEECNRIVVDHLSDILFCSDKISVTNANNEGIGMAAYCTGDIMFDTFLSVDSEETENVEEIVLLTWHRQENTCSKSRMESIIRFIRKINGKIICPMHPRTRKCLIEFGLWDEIEAIKNLEIIQPVGYLEMVSLMNKARLIITDSGGVSKESSFAGAKCLFMLDLDVWDDLIKCGWILKVNPEDGMSINQALLFADNATRVEKELRPQYYGDGHAAKKMADLLEEHFSL